jgi:hypothetical protein
MHWIQPWLEGDVSGITNSGGEASHFCQVGVWEKSPGENQGKISEQFRPANHSKIKAHYGVQTSHHLRLLANATNGFSAIVREKNPAILYWRKSQTSTGTLVRLIDNV